MRVRPPVSKDGPSATSGEVPELERRQGHDNGYQDSSAITTHTPKPRRPEPLEPKRRRDPATAPTTRLARPNPPCLASPRQSPASSHPPHPCPSDLPGPILLPPPRLRPLQLPAWASPSRFTGTVEEGGSGAKRRTPLPPRAQTGSQGNSRRRGGGLLRSGPKPIERNKWRETQGGKQGDPVGFSSLIPRAGFALLDHSTSDFAVDRVHNHARAEASRLSLSVLHTALRSGERDGAAARSL